MKITFRSIIERVMVGGGGDDNNGNDVSKAIVMMQGNCKVRYVRNVHAK